MKDAAKTYLRILLWVCAFAGVVCLSALQAGWLVYPVSDEPRPAKIDDWGEVSGMGKAKFLSDFIAVDPALTYDLSAYVRLRPRTDSNKLDHVNVYVGVVAYDRDKKEISSHGGSTRYPAGRQTPIYLSEAWHILSGNITGESDKDRDENHFLPGTEYVRVVFYIDSTDPRANTEVKNVAFAQRLSLK